MTSPKPKMPDGSPRPRGFAAMAPEQRAEISRKGGKAAQAAGTAHRYTSEEARVAGRIGGKAMHANRRRSEEATLGDTSTETM